MKRFLTTLLLGLTLLATMPKKDANAGLVIAGLATKENYLMYLGAGLGLGVAMLGAISAEITGSDTLGLIYIVMGGAIFLDEDNNLQKDAVVDHLTKYLPSSVDAETVSDVADQLIINHAAAAKRFEGESLIPTGLSTQQFNDMIGPLGLDSEDLLASQKVLL